MSEAPSTLIITLGEKPVGTIDLVASDSCLFSFLDSYIEDPFRPTLSLYYKSTAGKLKIHQAVKTLKLDPYFSNLLPEGALRKYLANLHGIKPVREYYLLNALGTDLSGNVYAISEGKLGDVAEEEQEESVEQNGDKLTFSLAGVQLKFSALVEASGGLTIPTSGMGGDWIVKLPSDHYKNLPENEFHMMDFARQIGINVPEVKMMPMEHITGIPEQFLSNKEKALAVKRFDRDHENNRRIHVEDFAQVFGVYPENKYDEYNFNSIARMIFLNCSINDLEEYIRRLVFNLAIGNSDMHLKNWSLIYPDTVTPALSPAYDLVCTISELEDDQICLRLGEKKKYEDISHHQFQILAHEADCPKGFVNTAVNDTVAKIKEVWKIKRQEIEHLDRVVRAIDNCLETVPVLRNKKD